MTDSSIKPTNDDLQAGASFICEDCGAAVFFIGPDPKPELHVCLVCRWIRETRHSYPSNYPPGTHWAVDEGWKILDSLAPGMLSDDARAYLCGQIAGTLVRMKEEATETEQLFDMQWKADQRAIKRWQEAHPERKDVWPDRADMVVWLMDQLERTV